MTTLIEVLDAFAHEVPGLLSCSVVHRKEGTNIGSLNSEHAEGLDADAADAYFTEMLNRNKQTMSAMGFEDLTEDILLTTESAFYLTRVMEGTDYFWNVITSRRGNLGLTRALMRKYEAMVRESLP